MQQIIWIALGYNVPINPSKNRVYVWRKLKEFGAGYFKQGVAILPMNSQSVAQFRSLAVRIREMGGEATLAELKFCDARDEAETVAWFERQSEKEYSELISDCAAVVKRLRESISPAGDEYVKKVNRRYTKARSRDYFRSRSHKEVVHRLDELFGDMAHVPEDLKQQLGRILLEK